MKKAIIAFANKAHKSPNAFRRRSSIVLALIGLAALEVLLWVALPVFFVIYPLFMMAKGFWDAISEMPSLTYNQAVSDIADWRMNLSGAKRIWMAQKVEPEIVRNP